MSVDDEKYGAAFKARVVLEALKAKETDSSIAKAYGVHPVTLSRWKQQLQKDASAIFGESDKILALRDEIKTVKAELEEQEKLADAYKLICTSLDIETKVQLARNLKDELGLNRVLALLELAKSTYYYNADEE
jgi:transposase-like protein